MVAHGSAMYRAPVGYSFKMASIVDGRESSFIEGHRTSLLDVVEDRNRSLNKKGLLHRLVVISKMCHNNFAEIGQYFEKFLRDVQNQYQNDGVTGIFLLYPKHCVQVVEGTLEVLLEVMKDIRFDGNNGNGHIERSKILIMSHDIPTRLFHPWTFRVLDIEAPRMDEFETNESPDRLVVDILTQLLKLGAHLARQPKVSLKNTMDALHEKVPELLPQQGVIGYLLEADHITCVETPAQYLEKYEKPYDTVLNSELVWPMPILHFPYH